MENENMKKKTILLTLLATCLLVWGCDTKTKNVDSCGDGYLDPGEECDQEELSVTNCQQLGYYEQGNLPTMGMGCLTI
jgi:hypothetical protein